ncbi:hypothetical protein AG1IA_02693 [Rhizoctonia solani AG-1 IA]|uniref:Uncharacterized protein n=1 Tax=Thanatephorus cucumeris (strain AG1-IA) TaxID=983506 RepID=L8WZ98_THACA|nr:hypothetical protein AG1IA_02693 [Rhizoctonia solani AG-1 IA]
MEEEAKGVLGPLWLLRYGRRRLSLDNDVWVMRATSATGAFTGRSRTRCRSGWGALSGCRLNGYRGDARFLVLGIRRRCSCA